MEWITLEEKQRLSQSIIWELQKQAYQQFGPEAWITKGVPLYITSAPFTVHRYVQLVIGYLRDCLSPAAKTPIDRSAPLYIVDLGAGAGRFSYVFIKTLLRALDALGLGDLKIRYVMTDIAEANIAFCREHPQLAPFVEKGLLDFAFFDPEQPLSQLELQVSKTTLKRDTVVNPMVFIANYFFDTTKHDLFRSQNGSLEEGLTTMRVVKKPETEQLIPPDPALIMHLLMDHDYRAIEDPLSYYPEDPILSQTVLDNCKTLTDWHFLVPIGAFQTIRHIRNLTGDRYLLIAADQGNCFAEEQRELGTAFLNLHGSFSIPTNYYLIGRYMEKAGGFSLATPLHRKEFVVTAQVMGGRPEEYPETHFAYDTSMGHFEPYDYFCLSKVWEAPDQKHDLESMLLLIKLGNGDSIVMHKHYSEILEKSKGIEVKTKRLLAGVLDEIVDNFFVLTPVEAAFILNLGVLYHNIGEIAKAKELYEWSLRIHPGYELALKNLEFCK